MRIRQQWRALLQGVRAMDAQTMSVLVLCVLLVAVQFKLGSRRFFLENLLPDAWKANRELLSWAWWFSVQGVTGFVLPVVILRTVFGRSLREIGLGLGDWRLAGTLALCYVPLVAAGTWILSDSPGFQAEYPHFRAAAGSWQLFAVYHMLFLLYWMGWEYLWRGFVLFGTARTFGLYAIFIQTVPFALLHLQKPVPELLLSILGGLTLGAVVWRCRSFWVAVPIHALQMLLLDLWCVLRLRTGATGVGLEAIRTLFMG